MARFTTYTPEELEKQAKIYFAWCDENPIMISDVVKGGENAGMVVYRPQQRPYTLENLCDDEINGLDITDDTFRNYEKRPEFFGVCSRIRQKINGQHLTYGLSGIFNANIVTRKLGLKESTESVNNNTNTNLNAEVTLTDEQIDRILNYADSSES